VPAADVPVCAFFRAFFGRFPRQGIGFSRTAVCDTGQARYCDIPPVQPFCLYLSFGTYIKYDEIIGKNRIASAKYSWLFFQKEKDCFKTFLTGCCRLIRNVCCSPSNMPVYDHTGLSIDQSRTSDACLFLMKAVRKTACQPLSTRLFSWSIEAYRISRAKSIAIRKPT